MEAEYIALVHAGCEARWFQNIYMELGFPLQHLVPIKCNNWNTVQMSGNPYSIQRSRHIDLKWHIIRQLIANNLVAAIMCRDEDQTADILTKLIPQPKYKKHTGEMGLVPV
jgi:hypothetical protein